MYSRSEIAQVFLAEKGKRVLSQPTKEKCFDFSEFLQMQYFDTDVRVIFGFVRGLAESTDPSKTVKLIMNYCPMSGVARTASVGP